MLRYIEEHKDRLGVEPICRQLPTAPSTYYELKAPERDPERIPARRRRDQEKSARFRSLRFEAWRIEYNPERTHSSLGNITPEEYAAGLLNRTEGRVSLAADSKSRRE
jgi:transposase InsO family protein